MFEVEIKARVKEFEKIKHSLTELGFKLVKKEHQKDNYFRSPFRNFEQTGEVLRIREQIPCHNLITYKGPRLKSGVKIRKEIEVRIDSGADATKLLHKLGFKIWITLEKERETYQRNEFSISLDKVRDIGNFIEIEMRTLAARPQFQRKIFDLLDKLGVSRNSIEEKSYLELVLEKEKVEKFTTKLK